MRDPITFLLFVLVNLLCVSPAYAQLIPDDTLGDEASRVVRPQPGNAEIRGGVQWGGNLFHSFQEFNVEEGGSVYFRDPVGIENILTRITGRNASNILGTLGVLGDANLFLLNPNGILFGPNATLDIDGSFTATTADAFLFPGGDIFSATNPEAPPLLTMNVPIGLQYNTALGQGWAGHIENQGILTVGQDLTLNGGFLNLSGTHEAGNDLRVRARGNILTNGVFDAGRDLTLQAQGMLHMEAGSRATADRHMRLQGNTAVNILLATDPSVNPLTLPQFASGGNLLLRSDGVITTQARFNSGGNFSVRTLEGEPGYWVNGQNAPVNVAGNYTVGNYTGPSLQVNAGGNITYGTVVIDAIAPAINPNHPIFALNAGGRIRGTGEISSTQPGLVVSLVSQGNISFQEIVTQGSPISLVSRGESITPNFNNRISTTNAVSGGIGTINAYANRNIASAFISSDASINAEGAINFHAGRNITNAFATLTRDWSIVPADDSFAGGTINFYAGQDIAGVFANANASILVLGTITANNSGDGGMVNFYAGRNISDVYATTETTVDTFTNVNDGGLAAAGSSGNGGTINIYAGQDITEALLDANASTRASANASPDNNGIITVGSSGNGGAINIYAGRDLTAISANANASVGADAFAFTNRASVATAGNSGNGGTINIDAGRDISQAFLDAYTDSIAGVTAFDLAESTATAGNSGNGGTITVHAGRDILEPIMNVGAIASAFTSVDEFAAGVVTTGSSGNGGTIDVYAGRDISDAFAFTYASASVNDFTSASTAIASTTGNSGDGGTINFYTTRDLSVRLLNSFSYSQTEISGNGGEIHLVSHRGRIDGGFTNFDGTDSRGALNSFSVGTRNSGSGGNISLDTQNGLANLEILSLSSRGESGDVQVEGSANLPIFNIRVLTSQQVQVEIFDRIVTILVGESGSSGQVAINSAGSLSLVDSLIESDTRSSNPAGDIFIRSPEQITLRNTTIRSNTSTDGSAGSISLTAPLVRFEDRNSIVQAQSSEEALGTAGDIRVITNRLSFLDGGQISSSTLGSGLGGRVNINVHPGASGRLVITGNGQVSSETSGQGRAGRIAITAPILTIQDQVQFTTASTSSATGQGGTIAVNAPISATLLDAELIAGTQTTGNAGDVILTTGQLNLSNARIQSESTPMNLPTTAIAGRAGDVRINADEVRLRDNAEISVSATGNATAGLLSITAQRLDLNNEARVTASTQAGSGGDIQLQRLDNLLLRTRSEISASTQRGQAGSIRIFLAAGGRGRLSSGSRVESAATEGGRAGDVELLNGRILRLNDGSEITVSSTQQGRAGRLTISIEQMRLGDRSRISATTEAGAGGNIRLRNTDTLTLDGNSRISASTQSGEAGDVRVLLDPQGARAIALNRGSQIESAATIGGQAGNLALRNGRSLILDNNSGISVSSTEGGRSGRLTVESQQVNLEGRSRIAAETEDGRGGSIQFENLNRLILRGNSTISASTEGGRAGNVRIPLQPGGIARLNNGSRIESAALGGGEAGGVSLRNSEVLTLNNGSGISVSSTQEGGSGELAIASDVVSLGDRSQIVAETEDGVGGNIRLFNLDNLTLDEESQISASTQGGRAGSVRIRMAPGSTATLNRDSQIESAAIAPNGQAGNLAFTTATLNLTASTISVSSPGGQAGGLTLTAEEAYLDNGQITAQTGLSASQLGEANIQLQGLNLLLMENGSLISAEALNNATGGNIDIDASSGFIIGSTLGNNDIIATAAEGAGGEITVRANRILGFRDRTDEGLSTAALRSNRTNDISASSEFGSAGTVALETLSVDPSQGLAALPGSVVDASNQVGQVCPTGPGASERLGRFVITGRGGIAPSPLGLQEDLGFSVDWMREGDANGSPAGTMQEESSSQDDHPFIEADGWQVGSDGQVQLVALTPNPTHPGTHSDCPTAQAP